MSDSLREQMLKAGFKETSGNKKKKSSRKSKQQNNYSSDAKKSLNHTSTPSSIERANIAEREAVATRKRIKSEIKTIIEAEKIEQIDGESVHSYVVGKRIKQLYVTETIRQQLVAGDLVITRLNGATYLVPADTGTRVQALNPDWVVIRPAADNESDVDDGYADYQVPDDLKW